MEARWNLQRAFLAIILVTISSRLVLCFHKGLKGILWRYLESTGKGF